MGHHVLAGKEMVESSDTDDDSDADPTSDNEIESKGSSSVVNKHLDGATTLKKVHKIEIKQTDPNRRNFDTSSERPSKKQSDQEDTEGEEGKTLMELLELEMRARAIKALLMKAGKEEGEAETLAIEEALDEKKKKEKEKEKVKPEDEHQSPKKERNL